MFIYKLVSQHKSKFFYFAAGILAAVGAMGSGFTDAVSAQSYSREEVANYARAGFQQEMLRQQVYQEIKSRVESTPPSIDCDRPETINNVEPSIRGIVDNYCDRSDRIVRQNNLSIERFNQLKSSYDSRGEFFEQVQEQLIDMQN